MPTPGRPWGGDRAAYVEEGEPCVLKGDQADRTVGARAGGTEHHQDR